VGAVTVITTVLVGLLFIVLMAGVVGFIDAWQASAWREVAAERRRRWEDRRTRVGPERRRLIGRRFGGPAVPQP
jgi:hypothetical protein